MRKRESSYTQTVPIILPIRPCNEYAFAFSNHTRYIRYTREHSSSFYVALRHMASFDLVKVNRKMKAEISGKTPSKEDSTATAQSDSARKYSVKDLNMASRMMDLQYGGRETLGDMSAQEYLENIMPSIGKLKK